MFWTLVNDFSQFETSSNIHAAGVTRTQFRTPEELFDPRKNKLFKRGINGHQWLAAIKSVYQPDNVFTNLLRLFPTLAYIPPAGFNTCRNKLIDSIPADKLFGLALVSQNWGHDIIQNPLPVVFALQVWGDDGRSFGLDEADQPRVDSHPIDTEAFWKKFSASVVKAADKLEALISLHGSKLYNTDGFNPKGLAGLILRYSMDSVVASVFVGKACRGTCNVSDLLRRINNTREGKLVVRNKGSACLIEWLEPADPNDRSHLYQIAVHSANVLDVIPYDRNKLTRPVGETLFGVELETCSNYKLRDLIDAQEKLFFFGKQDGSISGVGALKCELVTVPLSLSDHKVAWHKLFRKLDYTLFDTSVDTNNGMHVHIGKKVFGIDNRDSISKSSHLRKFVWFISHPGHLPFILAMSERKKQSLQTWAPIPSYVGMSKGKAYKTAVELAQMMRGAVNIHPTKPTIEVRLFKGIVSCATICKNLEFVDAVIEFTRNAGLRGVGLSFFFDWLGKTPRNKYQFLKTFVKEVKSEDMMDGAELFDAIFTEENPDRIISILKSKEFPLKSTHITLINQMKGKRTVMLDKGELTLNPDRKGKLCGLDRAFENNYCR